MNNFSSLVSWTNLHVFNTWLEQHVSWSTKPILDLPNYKYSAFCPRISQLQKKKKKNDPNTALGEPIMTRVQTMTSWG